MAHKKWFEGTLHMVNRDPNWYGFIDGESKEKCIESIKAHFDRFAGYDVTDVMLGLLESTTIVPSDSYMWRGLKYVQKLENGIEVDYTENKGIKALYKCYEEYNVDALQIYIDSMNAAGIRPWFSLRMNDAHFGGEPTSFLHSDMYYEELAAGHMIGDKYGYYKYCFDFTYPRIRQAINGFIAELLDKYDIFGLELDFMRECHCFDYKSNPDCHKIMTNYIRSIKDIVTAAEKRLGHDIKISIRLPRSIKDSKQFGFDVATLLDEGLVDVINPTGRWAATDSDIPIKEWLELIDGRAALVGGIESLNNIRKIGETRTFIGNTIENEKAYVAAMIAQGADGIYYNNHEYNTESWKVSATNCYEGRREMVVSPSDMYAYPENHYAPLPMVLDGKTELPLAVGKIKPTDKVTVLIDFEGENAPVICGAGKCGVKGTAAEPVKIVRRDETTNITPFGPLAYDFSGIEADTHITLTFDGCGTVHYVNVIIEA